MLRLRGRCAVAEVETERRRAVETHQAHLRVGPLLVLVEAIAVEIRRFESGKTALTRKVSQRPQPFLIERLIASALQEEKIHWATDAVFIPDREQIQIPVAIKVSRSKAPKQCSLSVRLHVATGKRLVANSEGDEDLRRDRRGEIHKSVGVEVGCDQCVSDLVVPRPVS